MKNALQKQLPETALPAFPPAVRVAPGGVDEDSLIGEHGLAARCRLQLIEMAIRLFIERKLQAGIEQE